MIAGKLDNYRDYCIGDTFDTVFDFLSGLTADAEEKKYELENGIYVSVESYSTKSFSDGLFEAHRKYIDVQVVLSGEEKIGWHPVDGLIPETEYDEKKDIVFYQMTAPYGWTRLEPGIFAVYFPADAHLPQIQAVQSLEVKKAVVKVPV